MARGIFITGTDTGVGKTHVSTLLVTQLVEQGLRVAVMKPIASGAGFHKLQWQNDDALQLMQVANVKHNYELVNPYCFEPAIAPHLAAQQANVTIQLDMIHECYAQLAANSDIVIVEGAGGWAVPLNEQQYFYDLVLRLKLDVVLVVGLRLGCLNHALLTADHIASKGAKLLGWIANHIEPQMAFAEQNIQTLQQRIPAPLLAILPFQNDDNHFLNKNISFFSDIIKT